MSTAEELHQLGSDYFHGKNGVKKDKEKALEYLIEAVEIKPNGKSLNMIGRIYQLVKKDYVTAVEYFKKSAKTGNNFGLNNLGSMYEKGLGVEKDISRAIKLYSLARKSEKGDKNFKRMKKKYPEEYQKFMSSIVDECSLEERECYCGFCE